MVEIHINHQIVFYNTQVNPIADRLFHCSVVPRTSPFVLCYSRGGGRGGKGEEEERVGVGGGGSMTQQDTASSHKAHMDILHYYTNNKNRRDM